MRCLCWCLRELLLCTLSGWPSGALYSSASHPHCLVHLSCAVCLAVHPEPPPPLCPLCDALPSWVPSQVRRTPPHGLPQLRRGRSAGCCPLSEAPRLHMCFLSCTEGEACRTTEEAFVGPGSARALPHVASPQAARGRVRPPCRHFKILSCFRLGSAFEVAAFRTPAFPCSSLGSAQLRALLYRWWKQGGVGAREVGKSVHLTNGVVLHPSRPGPRVPRGYIVRHSAGSYTGWVDRPTAVPRSLPHSAGSSLADAACLPPCRCTARRWRGWWGARRSTAASSCSGRCCTTCTPSAAARWTCALTPQPPFYTRALSPLL
jgi:hypothetical protein